MKVFHCSCSSCSFVHILLTLFFVARNKISSLFFLMTMIVLSGCQSPDFENEIPFGLINAKQGLDDFNGLSDHSQRERNLYHTSFIKDKNELVDKWVQYFQQGRGRESMEKYLSRSSRYIYTMKEIFRQNELPEELVYVAMIESGFSPYIRSRAGAVGCWQFLKRTGKQYGLQINGYVDERRDPILSTEAAARYLKELHRGLGSWGLALASYNAGKYRVNRASIKHGTKDFWHLSKKRSFPMETINYVPKFIAAVRIGENPRGYGFKYINYQKPLQYELLPLNFPISLRKLANKLGMNYKDLKLLNPSYLGEHVYGGGGNGVKIRIPPGESGFVRSVINQCRIDSPGSTQSSEYHWYYVQSGDTLSELAEQSGTSVFVIQQMNGMENDTLFIGQKIKLPLPRSVRNL